MRGHTVTEIAVPDSNDTATTGEQRAELVPAGAAQSDLVLWAYEAKQAHQIARSLASTSFVPAALRGKPAEITAAILTGRELRLQPMAALRSLDIIQGTPALRAHAMRGLVQSHGHKVWLVQQTPERVVMRGQRRESGGWGPEQQVEWTIERATQLGLTGKSEWKKQPQTMLTARATGEICRLIAADVLYAVPYAAEELLDHQGDGPALATSGHRVTAAEILGRRADESEPADAATPDTPDLATEPGLALAELFGRCGWTELDDQLYAASVLLKREVHSIRGLAPDEVRTLAATLDEARWSGDPDEYLSGRINRPSTTTGEADQ
jgi:hypothetical protein